MSASPRSRFRPRFQSWPRFPPKREPASTLKSQDRGLRNFSYIQKIEGKPDRQDPTFRGTLRFALGRHIRPRRRTLGRRRRRVSVSKAQKQELPPRTRSAATSAVFSRCKCTWAFSVPKRCHPGNTGWHYMFLLFEPDVIQSLIEVMARGDFPALHIAAMRVDLVPPHRDRLRS